MKRFFQLSGLIFLFFALTVGVGAVLPETQSIERSAIIEADIEDVSDYLSDLRTWPDWSHHVPDTARIAYGQPTGTGAGAAWQGADGVGSVDLIQVSPDELIRAEISADGRISDMTIALAQDDGATTMLVQQTRDLGGFPFLGRVRGKIVEGREDAAIAASLETLSSAF